MKHRLNLQITIALTAVLFAATLIPALAAETNETKQSAGPEKKIFFFEGGRPIDFILAMDRHFRTRLEQILSIPSSLAQARVPKMKIRSDRPADALHVYNNLQDPMLGQWKFEAPASGPWDPSVLALVPDKDVAVKSGVRVRALPIQSLPESMWGKLQEDIEVARMHGLKEAERLGGDRYDGSIQIQRESKILIAAGSEAFIEMVESVVNAHRENNRNN